MDCPKLARLPEKLKDLSDPPKQLFYQGSLNLEIFDNCVAVVGSRRMTDYGRRVIEKLVPKLVFEGKTIVSGFMYGVDQYAHKICLDNGGKTIAVLGWGINCPLTDYDKKLAGEIIASGSLIISEWESQQAALWTFPIRNRIVAALSEEVFVIEAAIQSGSLITANWAIKLKRKLWAIPGPITSKTSAGTNELIASKKAEMWLGKPVQQALKIDDPILQVLENEALTTDEVARKLVRPVAEVGAEVSILLLSGAVVERSGKYYLAEA